MDKQKLWDDFLVRWPREELKNLTLEQYVAVKDRKTGVYDTFIYWLETKTIELGSIQGNTAIKFGIYKRLGAAKKQKNIIDGEFYSWKSSYGNSEEEAFSKIRSLLIKIAKLAYKGDLEAIENIEMFPLVKWKIAFMYQNQSNPSLINIFSKKLLEALHCSTDKFCYSIVYKKLIQEKETKPLLEYGITCLNKAKTEVEKLKNKKIIQHFIHKPSFLESYGEWTQHVISAFCNIIYLANKESLDVFTTNMVTGSVIRIGRKEKSDEKAIAVFATFEPLKSKVNYEQRYIYGAGKLSLSVKPELTEQIKKSKHLKQFNESYPIKRKAYWPSDYQDDSTEEQPSSSSINEPRKDYMLEYKSPINQIFYGPPGSGKTYHTIEAAVIAADPAYYSGLKSQYSVQEDTKFRKALIVEYKKLVAANRIRFVTFHQSYGYEEFVEGIRAKTEDGKVSYYEKKGVFRLISEAASNSGYDKAFEVKPDAKVWKISILGTGKNNVKDYCFEHGIAAIDWGKTGDLSEGENNDYFKSLGKNNKNSIVNFTQEVSEGDVILCIDSNKSVQAIGVVNGDYKYVEAGIEGHGYPHHLPVNWLNHDFSVSFHELNNKKQFTLQTCYELKRLQPAMVFEHLKKNGVVIKEQVKGIEPDNYVLIIDEINRGNISKIFGELITLIEPSKRAGKNQEESLEVTLPYSGDKFSVPDNLYIIGTMNTADRSLALMDTALRRRFDFIEMMPDYNVLCDEEGQTYKIESDGLEIDLSLLLQTLNRRISALYDREHQLGHAFLMPTVKAIIVNNHDAAFDELKNSFQNKIIPLLAEYFFEDWQKIRLVLGDNQKSINYQLVQQCELDYEMLFGDSDDIGDYADDAQDYKLIETDSKIWLDALTYLGMYQTSDLPKDEG